MIKDMNAQTKKYKFEINGITVSAVAALVMVVLVTKTPQVLANVIYGLCGIYTFSLCVVFFLLGLGIKFSRKYKIKRKYLIYSGLMIFALFTSVHLAFTYAELTAGATFSGYLEYGFNHLTPGGILFAVPSFILYTLCQLDGSFIVLGVLFIICAGFVTTDIVTTTGERTIITKLENPALPEALEPTPPTRESELQALDKKVEIKYQELLQKQSRNRLNSGKSELNLTAPPRADKQRAIYDSPIPLESLARDTITPAEEITQWSTEAANKLNSALESNSGIGLPDFLPSQKYQTSANYLTPQPLFKQSGQSYAQPQAYQNASQNQMPPNNTLLQNVGIPPVQNFPQQPGTPVYPSQFGNISTAVGAPQSTESDVNNLRINRRLDQARSRNRGSIDDRINARADDSGEQIKMDVVGQRPQRVYKPKRYMRPPIDLIRTESSNLSEFHIEALAKQKLLDEKLKEFGVNAKVTSFTVAPAVTRFDIQLSSGVRVNQVEQLSKDISYVLGSTQVRLELIEGKNAIGVEVPNKRVGIVSIKDLIGSREFQQHKSPLAVAIGKNINDELVVGDLAEMPHLLIAGSTGSGKSVCLNTLLTSLLFRAHPDEVKLILVDMKRVELNMYNEVPHMLIPRAIKEVNQVINALKWMQTEMSRRYDLMEKSGVNRIALYHALPGYQQGTMPRMPYIVMVIDEAADLIARGKKDVEESIKSLSSLARACGIHIVLATQRPSVDVITSVIKTNFTVRIAFKVSSRGDSVTIINTSGAEKLVGRGDMLFVRESLASRVQGAYIELEETRKVMNFIRENNEAEFDLELEDIILNGPPAENNAASGFGDADGIRGAGGRGTQDPMFVQVLKWLVRDDNLQKIASISGFQRQFGIGFARAGKIIDQLADAGYVSQGQGTKVRQVLVSREEVERIYGE